MNAAGSGDRRGAGAVILTAATCWKAPAPDGRLGGVLREARDRDGTTALQASHDRLCAPPIPPAPVIGVQSGRTSAPISPHAVQTMRGHSARTAASSGSQSAASWALWLHHGETQETSSSRQPWPRMWPMVTGGKVCRGRRVEAMRRF
jgi:hypothetical protein